MSIAGREIVLGVTGGIAAYKSAEIVSRLRHLGARVNVIMTKNATEFVQPLTFQTLSGNPVVTDTFRTPDVWNVEHVALARLAEVFVIAPASGVKSGSFCPITGSIYVSTSSFINRVPRTVHNTERMIPRHTKTI